MTPDIIAQKQDEWGDLTRFRLHSPAKERPKASINNIDVPEVLKEIGEWLESCNISGLRNAWNAIDIEVRGQLFKKWTPAIEDIIKCSGLPFEQTIQKAAKEVAGLMYDDCAAWKSVGGKASECEKAWTDIFRQNALSPKAVKTKTTTPRTAQPKPKVTAKPATASPQKKSQKTAQTSIASIPKLAKSVCIQFGVAFGGHTNPTAYACWVTESRSTTLRHDIELKVETSLYYNLNKSYSITSVSQGVRSDIEEFLLNDLPQISPNFFNTWHHSLTGTQRHDILTQVRMFIERELANP